MKTNVTQPLIQIEGMVPHIAYKRMQPDKMGVTLISLDMSDEILCARASLVPNCSKG